MDMTTSKYLGGIGALLIFIGILPQINAFGVLPLVGIILVLAALYGLADAYKERGIFNNALYGSIIGIAGVAIIVAVIFLTLVSFLQTIFPSWNGDWTTLQNINPADVATNINLNTVGPFIASFLIALVLLFLIAIAVAFFYRKSYNLLASKTGTGLFRTAGTLLLVGAIFTIIILGLILIWISMLLLAIAFFSMRTQQPPPTPTQTSTQV
jgi:uncharacterized membrane protein